jgi:RecB family endonuclease NucS
MRLIVARCEVIYAGRVSSVLPMATRLIMWKSDGSIMVHSDAGGYKPENWMTPPTRIVEEDAAIIVEKGPASRVERLEIRIEEMISDSAHDMGEAARLVKDGVERDLQIALADAPQTLGEGMKLVRREYPTPIGPVDLMCIDTEGYVAVEVKRVGTIDAVEQLTRYLEYIRAEHGMEACRGILVAESIKPQARTLARSRDMDSLELNLAELRGLKEPDLKLFG